MAQLIETVKKQTEKLRIRGLYNPEKDARSLICAALNLDPVDYILCTNKNLCDSEMSKIDSFIDRRLKFEPVSKIIGKRYFWDLEIFVDSNVLDPRPESEILIEKVLENTSNKRSILDLGTGSGCLAIVLSSKLGQSEIDGIDISKEALKVARKNANKNNVQVNFFQSNWFSNIDKKYDIIVSNPPYISKSEFVKLPRGVKFFDPGIALYGGEDGLVSYRIIARSIVSYLNDEGLAFFEIGQGQTNAVLKIFENQGLSLVSVWKDLDQNNRIICVKKDA